jgi:3-polyprenyl-4-hydroxybenzoate decarboxylase
MEETDEYFAAQQRQRIASICNVIWGLEGARGLRWLFITDADADLESEDWRRNLLWQLFCRFDVGRDLHFDEARGRVAWDATAPIPSNDGPLPVRRWPAVTLHDPELAERVDKWLAEVGH